jgi:putative aldouronate transport system permease protein
MVIQRRSPRNRLQVADYILIVAVTLICLSMLYPFINILFISMSDISEVTASNGMLLYPKSVTLEAYRYVIQYNDIWNSYKNTIFITIVGTLYALVMTTMGAYVLSKRNLPGVGILTGFILVTMFFSGGMIPTYLNFRNLNLLNTLWVLILPCGISTWNLLLERNFFQAIPAEINESAKLDGASEMQQLLYIMLPLSKPILATLALFYGVSRWNEYSGAIIYNSKSEFYTLQVILNRMYKMSIKETIDEDFTRNPPTETIRCATVIFTTLPILCVYPFLQKYFAKGVMVGSLKG